MVWLKPRLGEDEQPDIETVKVSPSHVMLDAARRLRPESIISDPSFPSRS